MHGYKQIEHTADIAIEIYADSIENLFRAGTDAWRDISVSGNDFPDLETKKIKLEAASFEELLIEFLSEINFLLHVNKWLAASVDYVALNRNNGNIFLEISITGNKIDFELTHVKEEIKAVTYHQVDIRMDKGLYITRIVFDI